MTSDKNKTKHYVLLMCKTMYVVLQKCVLSQNCIYRTHVRRNIIYVFTLLLLVFPQLTFLFIYFMFWPSLSQHLILFNKHFLFWVHAKQIDDMLASHVSIIDLSVWFNTDLKVLKYLYLVINCYLPCSHDHDQFTQKCITVKGKELCFVFLIHP